MKKLLKIKFLALICFVLTLNLGCSSDDSISQEALVTIGQTALANGTWQVSLYSENNTNKTSDFTGYSFIFTPSGAMLATRNSTEYPGIWLMGVDSGKAKLNLTFFATNGPLEEISENWDILDVSTNRIQLRHVSGGNGTTDLLTFQRN
jgi:hypothetical protein